MQLPPLSMGHMHAFVAPVCAYCSVMDNHEVKEALSQHIVKGESALRDALAGELLAHIHAHVL